MRNAILLTAAIVLMVVVVMSPILGTVAGIFHHISDVLNTVAAR